MSPFVDRRKRLLATAQGCVGVLAVRPQNVFYLTGFWGGACAAVSPDRTLLVTSRMERSRAEAAGRDVEVVVASSGKETAERCARALRGKVVADSPDSRFSYPVDPAPFNSARRAKDSEELRRIAEASRRIDAVYEALAKTIAAGKTERQIAARAMERATQLGLTPLGAEGSLDPITVASGANGSYPHAGVTDRTVREGDLLTADLFFRYEGYCSDCTRTFGVGRVSREARSAYEAVRDAQAAGLERVGVGASCKDLDAAVRGVLRSHGLLRFFTHGTGHGVGIDIHEAPSIGRLSTDAITEGDVVTVEPGVYLPGRFGIRVEDTVHVGRTVKDLHSYTKDLLVLG